MDQVGGKTTINGDERKREN